MSAREVPCLREPCADVEDRITFRCPCGAYWYIQRPLGNPQPQRVNCNCGKGYQVYDFPGLSRVWEILEPEEV